MSLGERLVIALERLAEAAEVAAVAHAQLARDVHEHAGGIAHAHAILASSIEHVAAYGIPGRADFDTE